MPEAAKACSVKGCGRPVKGKGLCSAHYFRQRRGVSLKGPVRPPPSEETPALVATKVAPDLKKALEVEAERRGISLYALVAEILENWRNHMS
jgi:hypothetical protein